MPNTSSAKKAMRQSAKKRLANRDKKATVRTFEKKIRKALAAGNFEQAESAYSEFSSSIDKAAKTNVIHKNTASRKKSRLAKQIKADKQKATA